MTLVASLILAQVLGSRDDGIKLQILVPPGSGLSSQSEVLSDDGLVVYGVATSGPDLRTKRPWRWKAGREEILPVPKGAELQDYFRTVGDGRMLLGFVQTNSGYRPCRWIDGVPTILPAPAGVSYAYGTAIAGDGSVVGFVMAPSNAQACVWNSQGEFARSIPKPQGAIGIMPMFVSVDGKTVAGSLTAEKGADLPISWSSSGGRFKSVGDTEGRPMTLHGLSRDGRTLLLYREDPEDKEGQRAHVGEIFLTGSRSMPLPPPTVGSDKATSHIRLDPTGTLVVLHTTTLLGEKVGDRRVGPIYLRTPERYLNLTEMLKPHLGEKRLMSVREVSRVSEDRAVLLGLAETGELFRAEVPL